MARWAENAVVMTAEVRSQVLQCALCTLCKTVKRLRSQSLVTACATSKGSNTPRLLPQRLRLDSHVETEAQEAVLQPSPPAQNLLETKASEGISRWEKATACVRNKVGQG